MKIGGDILQSIGNTLLVRLRKVEREGCANVIAAIKIAGKLALEANVVTLLVDSGLKYLSTDVYKNL